MTLSNDHKMDTANAEAIRRFIVAGRSTFSLRSTRTGKHYTYRVRCPRGEPEAVVRFVDVLTGPDNTSNFSWLGSVWTDKGGKYTHGRTSRLPKGADSERVFTWFWRTLAAGKLHDDLEFFHAGKCGRCGRQLTTPRSVETGIGPVCEGAM